MTEYSTKYRQGGTSNFEIQYSVRPKTLIYSETLISWSTLHLIFSGILESMPSPTEMAGLMLLKLAFQSHPTKDSNTLKNAESPDNANQKYF